MHVVLRPFHTRQSRWTGNRRYAYILLGIAAAILLIACINFTNLATARSMERVKEIGMRKVMGAERRQLIGQFLGEAVLLSLLALGLAVALTELVLVGFVLAVPLAYVGIDRWLATFPYRTEIGADVFLLAGGLALAIAWLTVSYQAIRTALTNPVEALRYE